jgi:5,10-methylenetetrahydromethanopterin reductase
MPVRLGLRIPPAAPAPVVADAIVRAEELGWDSVWIPDSQLLWRDPFAVLAIAATRTSRIRLGIAVTNFATRHVSALAGAIRTIGELAPGRFVVAVGAGNSSVRPVGLRPTGTRGLGAEITRLRTLLDGGEVDFGARPIVRLRDAAPVPVYVAATGPRNLEMAGAAADGAILQVGTTVDGVNRGVTNVADGARSADRDPGSVPVVVTATCLLTDDLDRDAVRFKPHAVTIAGDGGGVALAKAGITVRPLPAEGAPVVYPDLLHAEDHDTAVRACDPYVTDADAVRFATRFAFGGEADAVRARIAEMHALGATEVLLQHIGSYDMPTAIMEQVDKLRP